MRRKLKTITIPAGLAGALTLALAFGASARSGEEPAKEEARREAPAAGLQVVETREVCMVNDRFFAREQIPVEVDGKTYYGCCEGCKKRLAEDEAIRQANDPVTGHPVDKATAVITARPDGSVLYFSSEETLARYLEESP